MTPQKSENEFKHWLVDLRNEFHKYPELSGTEIKTTRTIHRVLESLGIPVTAFDDLTGAVGLIRGGKAGTDNGPTLAVRADIDALPLAEAAHKPYRSRHEGIMHACGHDANTAILLGVARKIMDSGLPEKIAGHIKLIFQPAEEKLGGALSMIKKGVLASPRVDRIIAGHMDPNFPVGTVGVFTRIGHAASDPFELTVRGKGSHGARPHRGINPITAGGMFVSGLDTIIQRHVGPAESAVISAGSFHAGNAGNVIPDTAVIKGSIRTHDPDVRERVIRAVKDLAQSMDFMFNTRSDLLFGDGAPLGMNDPEACRALRRASEQVLGPENVKVLPFIMGSDDFYFYTRECPGAMMRFGCAHEQEGIIHPLHSPEFDIHEDVLSIGAEVLFKAVENFFKDGSGMKTR